MRNMSRFGTQLINIQVMLKEERKHDYMITRKENDKKVRNVLESLEE